MGPTARVRAVEVRKPLDDRWPDHFAAAMFGFAALVTVVAVVPPWRDYFAREQDIVSMLTIPIVPSLVYAALLVAMGVALRRRLRAAWWLLVLWWLIVPEIARIGSLLDGGSWVQAIGLVLIAAVLVVAWRARPQFLARRVPGSLWQAIAVFVVGGGLVLVGGAALVRRFGDAGDFANAAQYVLDEMFTDIGVLAPDHAVTAPWWVRGLTGLAGAAVVLLAAQLLFRAPKQSRTLDVADEARIRTLLRDFGGADSLGYFATRRDKSIIWDSGDPATAQSGVSYRAIGSVSLASGNPVGDPEHWPMAIEQWREHARSKGLSLAVMGAGEEGAAAFAEAGLTAYEIGDEAVLDLRTFSLNRPGLKAVRQSVARLQRRGYTTDVVRHSSLTADEFGALSTAAASWRGDGGDERGFSMALGRPEDPLDGECVLVRAQDAEGTLRGFLSFVPWGHTGLSLDLMRRDPSADNGLVELMVAALAEESATFGIGRVSLNFAMFREAFERGAELGAGPVARLWRQALLVASRNWQLESLYRSNAKYLPDWQPRFMCFEYTSDLPRVGTAAGSAEGFLTRPSLSMLRGKHPAAALDTAGADHAAAVTALIPAPPDPLAEALSVDNLPEQVRVRRAKLDRIRASGVDPYPVTYPRTHTLAQVRAEAGDLPPGTSTGRRVAVTGRILLKRDHGRLGFAKLRDGSGDLQLMVDLAGVGAEQYDFWRHEIDLGDQVGVTGEVITTRRGELSVRAESLRLTSKSIRPLPDKFRGLVDPEARIRARYVDLIVRPAARDVAYTRSTVVRSVRDSLQDADATWGVVLEGIYEELCERATSTPVFYTDFPKDNAPLTRPHRVDPRLAEKWDLVIFAAEQGTAYSELIDPVDQRARLVAQSQLAAAGDPEAMQVDEDFLEALEYGMPPTGGMGMGIDRLVMNLTGLSIRDTILFPLVRPNG
ncbi:bifunctional lysylphosphatidylglycerol synthetase/lysine--tRNA ligase LysX [Kribbella sp. NPDC054772]